MKSAKHFKQIHEKFEFLTVYCESYILQVKSNLIHLISGVINMDSINFLVRG